jgi:hypothetical protein
VRTLRQSLVGLVLCWQCFASVERLEVAAEGKAGFRRMAGAETGLNFTNLLRDDRAYTNRNLLSGSGVAAGDVDGDGRIDLFFCGLDNGNVLYRNLGGWRFEEVTKGSPGLVCEGWDCTGAAFADVDGDGDLDLLVNALGRGTHLFMNDGKGVFAKKPDSGLATNGGSTSMALADIDGDGDLDLYVTNFRPTTIRDNPTTRFTVGRIGERAVVTHVDGRAATAADLTNRFAVMATGEVLEYGEADRLYENDGTGRFREIGFTSGRFLDAAGLALKEAPRDWGLAVQFRDFTGDGAPDIYICNDYWTPDRIWINDGKGNFRAAGEKAIRSTSLSSMGVDFADVNRDGFPDCIVVDMLAREHARRQVQVGELPMYGAMPGEFGRMQLAQNTLQLNRGDGTFAQIGEFCGVEGSEWSWTPIFLDVDLDGWEDLLVSNGHRRDFQNADATAAIQEALATKRLSFGARRGLMEMFPPLATANAAFRNNRDLTFTDAAAEWGLTGKDLSHGACLADLDGDGDLDLVMNNLGSACGIYRNESAAGRVAVRLVGKGKNRFGVGATITVRTGTLAQTQEMISGGRYLSSDAPERVFAVGMQENATIEVRWRNGKRTMVRDVKANHRYVVRED